MNVSRIDTRQIRRNFSLSAGEYDQYAQVQHQVVERLLGLACRHLVLSGPVLDVGTGTGRLAARLQSVRPDLDIVLSDLAHGMTSHAATLLPEASAVDADASALPIGSESIGTVMSSSVYQWLGDLRPAFRECFRILQPGGWFVFALFGDRTLFELRQSHRLAAIEEGRPSHVQRFPDLDQVRRALETAGFFSQLLLVEEVVEEHDDVSTLLRSLKKIGARNAAAERPAGLSSRRLIDRMIRHYQQEFGSTGLIPATYEIIYALAQKSKR